MCLPLKLYLCFNSVCKAQQISYGDICKDIVSFFPLSKTVPSSSDSKALEDQPSPKYSDANEEFYSFIQKQ